MKKIQDDQLLDLLTVKTEVRAVCKEPYRLSHKSQFQCFRFVYSTVYVGWCIWHHVHFKYLVFLFCSSIIIMHLFVYNLRYLAIHLEILFFVCSIYKAVLKSKSSISEINQIAQVCFLLCPGLLNVIKIWINFQVCLLKTNFFVVTSFVLLLNQSHALGLGLCAIHNR